MDKNKKVISPKLALRISEQERALNITYKNCVGNNCFYMWKEDGDDSWQLCQQNQSPYPWSGRWVNAYDVEELLSFIPSEVKDMENRRYFLEIKSRPNTNSNWFIYDEAGIGSGKCLKNFYTEAETFVDALGEFYLFLLENPLLIDWSTAIYKTRSKAIGE